MTKANCYTTVFVAISMATHYVLGLTTECGQGDIIKQFGKFNAFMPVGAIDQCCKVLPTIYDGQTHTKLSKQLELDLVRFPTEFICGRREEYKQSVACFSSKGLQEKLEYRCIRKIPMFSCGACAQMSNCVTEVLKNIQGCTPDDSQLMVSLVRLYFHPIREIKKCNEMGRGPADENYCPIPVIQETTTTPILIDTLKTSSKHVTVTSSQSSTNQMTTGAKNTSDIAIVAAGRSKTLARVNTNDDNGCTKLLTPNYVFTIFSLISCSVVFAFNL